MDVNRALGGRWFLKTTIPLSNRTVFNLPVTATDLEF